MIPATSKLSFSICMKNTGMPGDGGQNTLDTMHRKFDTPISEAFDTFFFFFFYLNFSFQLLDKLWSQVSSLLPPGTCLQFLSRIGFSIPTTRRFSSNVANSRSRAFRESICAQEKLPMNLYEYALGGTRTHAIDLYQARG